MSGGEAGGAQQAHSGSDACLGLVCRRALPLQSIACAMAPDQQQQQRAQGEPEAGEPGEVLLQSSEWVAQSGL